MIRRPAILAAGLAALALLGGCAEAQLAGHLRHPRHGGIAADLPCRGALRAGRTARRAGGALSRMREVGLASWYGPGLQGRRTANGGDLRHEPADRRASQPPAPGGRPGHQSRQRAAPSACGSTIVGRSPATVSSTCRAARRSCWGFRRQGVARVQLRVLEEESLALRTELTGRPAAPQVATRAGPSTAGPSTAGPSTAGPSTAGTTAAGPSTAGPSTAGTTAAGTMADPLGSTRPRSATARRRRSPGAMRQRWHRPGWRASGSTERTTGGCASGRSTTRGVPRRRCRSPGAPACRTRGCRDSPRGSPHSRHAGTLPEHGGGMTTAARLARARSYSGVVTDMSMIARPFCPPARWGLAFRRRPAGCGPGSGRGPGDRHDGAGGDPDRT